jgi:hypothetical protein
MKQNQYVISACSGPFVVFWVAIRMWYFMKYTYISCCIIMFSQFLSPVVKSDFNSLKLLIEYLGFRLFILSSMK